MCIDGPLLAGHATAAAPRGSPAEQGQVGQLSSSTAQKVGISAGWRAQKLAQCLALLFVAMLYKDEWLDSIIVLDLSEGGATRRGKRRVLQCRKERF